MRDETDYPLDAKGIAICPPRRCSICGDMVSTRPDGSLRSHSRMRSEMHPRLGVEACPGGRKS